MTDYRDAYGQQLYEAYLLENEFEVIERRDGYLDICDATHYLSMYKDWPSHERKAMRYMKGKVLDIGCGAGRHALYAQHRGHDVLGVDISPLAIKVCKRRGLKKTKQMSITQVSRKLGIFDTLLMLGNNFGLVGNPKRARWLLRRFYGMTSDQGKIIAGTLDPYDTTDRAHLDYHKENRDRGRMGGQVRMRIRQGRHVGDWFDYLFVSRKEMDRLLRGSGWTVSRFLEPSGPAYAAILEKRK